MTDNHDFDEFMRLRQQPLLRFATVLTGNPRLSEDIVADVLARTWEKWARISAMSQPNAYVRRMIVNDFLSWRRRVVRTTPRDDLESLFDDANGGSSDYASAYVERDAFVARLARLPRKQRAVLALRFYEGMSDAEIAEVLGCKQVTVRSNTTRALAALRIQLQGEPSERVAQSKSLVLIEEI
jgi:RNA polymerase sigma-70 factor (sigma-E family)